MRTVTAVVSADGAACRRYWLAYVRRGLGADISLRLGASTLGRGLDLLLARMQRSVDLVADLPLCQAQVAEAP